MKPNWYRVPRRVVWEVAFLFVLIVVLLFAHKSINGQTALTITLAVIGWFLGIWYLFISINAKTKLDLELKASKEVIKETRAYGEALSTMHAIVNFTFRVQPPVPHPYFWHQKALEYYDTVNKQSIEMSQVAFRQSIEANEMAIIPLELLYRYITLKHDLVNDLLQDANAEFNTRIHPDMTEADYYETTKIYEPFGAACLDLVVLCLDLTKEVLNHFQSNLFSRTLLPRKPNDGTKTLKQLATKKTVEQMIKDRDKKLGL